MLLCLPLSKSLRCFFLVSNYFILISIFLDMYISFFCPLTQSFYQSPSLSDLFSLDFLTCCNLIVSLPLSLFFMPLPHSLPTYLPQASTISLSFSTSRSISLLLSLSLLFCYCFSTHSLTLLLFSTQPLIILLFIFVTLFLSFLHSCWGYDDFIIISFFFFHDNYFLSLACM